MLMLSRTAWLGCRFLAVKFLSYLSVVIGMLWLFFRHVKSVLAQWLYSI